MKKFLAIAAVAATLTSTPALAWGDREQGILTGIIGTLIIQDINRNQQPQQPVIVQQPPVAHTTVIIQDSAWSSNRVCSEQIIRRADGSQSTLQMNCAGRVVGEIIYNRY